MGQLSSLALTITVSLTVSTVVTVIMSAPLSDVLRQLCLNHDAATFWVPFKRIMFFVAPLFFSMVFEPAVQIPSLGNTIRTALASSLFGTFAALLVVGYQVAKARPVARETKPSRTIDADWGR